MKASRIVFVILQVVFAIIAVAVLVRWIKNRDSTELIPQSSNVEYTQWELPEGAKARLGKGSINDIKFSPDGTRFAVATTIGVWMYDALTGTEISLFKGDRQDVKGIAFSADGRLLTGANFTGGISRWNADTGELFSTFTTTEKIRPINSVAFSADSTKFVSAGSQMKVHVWDNSNITAPPTITMIVLEAGFGFIPVIALTPDKRVLATAIHEGKNGYPIHIWKTDTGKRLLTLTGHTRRIKSLAFSPDGKVLASGDEYRTIHLWDLDTATSHATYKASVSFSALTFSPNGKLLASGSGNGSVRLWNAESKQEGWRGAINRFLPTLTLKGHKDGVSALAFSPDGKTLLTGSDDGTIRAWDTITGKEQFRCPGHTSEISGLAVSDGGNTLISVHSWKNQLLHWDINVGHHLSGTFFKWKSPEAISPDATTLIMKDWKGKNKIKLWNISKNRDQVILEGHRYPSIALNFIFAFSFDGKKLASTTLDNKQIGVVHVWDITNQPQSFLKSLFSRSKTIQPRYTLEGHTASIGELAFSPNGKILASGGSDKIICLWEVETGSNLFTLTTEHKHTIRALAFSPDGKTLVSGGNYKTFNLWDVATGQQLTENQNVETANILRFSPDGKTLVSGTYNGKIQLLDARTLRLLSTHNGHTSWINALVFGADGKTLVSASRDGTILLWDWEKLRFGNK